MPICKIQISHCFVLCFMLLMLSSAAMADVYKCDGPDGPVFSDIPCGPSASQLDLADSQKTSGLGVPVTATTQSNLAEAKSRRQRGFSINRINQRRDSDVAVIDAQIAALSRQKGSAKNNLAGATYGAGIDQQLAALRQVRASVIADYRSQVMQIETE